MHLTLGQKLKVAREAKGLSLPDVAHVTKIPVNRLRHLEEDNYAAFGSMTYARSFLRAYSHYLEVEPDEVLGGLPAEPMLAGQQDYGYLTKSLGPWIHGGQRSLPAAPAAAGVVRHSRRSPVSALAVLFVVLLVVTGVWAKVAGTWLKQPALAEEEEAPVSQAVPIEEEGNPAESPAKSEASAGLSGNQTEVEKLSEASAPPDPAQFGEKITIMRPTLPPPGGFVAPAGPDTPVKRAVVVPER